MSRSINYSHIRQIALGMSLGVCVYVCVCEWLRDPSVGFYPCMCTLVYVCVCVCVCMYKIGIF